MTKKKKVRFFSPAAVEQFDLLVNFVGSKISSTEKEVLWLSGSLAASGCILDRSGLSGCQCSCGPLYRASAAAHAAGALAHLHFIHKVTQIARCVLPGGGGAGHCFQCAHLQTRSGPVWDPRVGTSKWKCPLSAGGALSQLFIAGHLVKMCPLSFAPCSSLCFGLSLFANARFYAGRTREPRL